MAILSISLSDRPFWSTNFPKAPKSEAIGSFALTIIGVIISSLLIPTIFVVLPPMSIPTVIFNFFTPKSHGRFTGIVSIAVIKESMLI